MAKKSALASDVLESGASASGALTNGGFSTNDGLESDVSANDGLIDDPENKSALASGRAWMSAPESAYGSGAASGRA